MALYFADLAAHYHQNGFNRVDIFFDRNPTHKTQMQNLFNELTENLAIKVHFHFMAPYSPKLNLVEYAIHVIRQKILHHAECKNSLVQFENYVTELCHKKKIFDHQQIINILQHIESLIPIPNL